MISTKRIGTYSINIDENGVKLADTGNISITLTHTDALAFADFVLSHRTDIEAIQQQQAGEMIAPPATEPE